jgi:hypothetical protein
LRRWIGRAGLGLVCVLSAAPLLRGAGLDPNAILSRIKAHGARPVLEQLFDNDDAWGAVLDGIATATPPWLRVAAAFWPVADDDAADELRDAVSKALPNAPAAVLGLTSQGFTVDDICNGPQLEEDDDVFAEWLERAERAVRGIKDPKLRARRDQCLKLIREAGEPDSDPQPEASQRMDPMRRLAGRLRSRS